MVDDTATVTFTGGRSYDYTVADVTSFVSALSEVISSKESVGRFVNQAIKSERLQKVAAWWRGAARALKDVPDDEKQYTVHGGYRLITA